MGEVDILRRRLARTQSEVKALERMMEERSRLLFDAKDDLRESLRFLGSVLEAMSSAVLVISPAGVVTKINPATSRMLQRGESQIVGEHWSRVVRLGARGSTQPDLPLVESSEAELLVDGERCVPVLFSGRAMPADRDALPSIVCVASDVSSQRRLELELRHAQKLESVGQLAAGIAHEINTPIQFVGDSLRFLGDAFADLQQLLQRFRGERASLPSAAQRELEDLEQSLDSGFLEAEIPEAVGRGIEGVDRVSTIVRAMKEFAHPGRAEMAPEDLNAAIRTTATIARNEYKYAAELKLELGDIPMVVCSVGDINQVLLNLIVNASHAIADKHKGSQRLGTITIRTRSSEGFVEIEVGDDGLGIPTEVQPHVFEPFFTTKEVGRGSGQGLAISHNIVTKRHKGSIRFETIPGQGTRFIIALPLRGAQSLEHAA